MSQPADAATALAVQAALSTQWATATTERATRDPGRDSGPATAGRLEAFLRAKSRPHALNLILSWSP
ncbi:DUF6207 family protein [Streptomyces sp. B21-083]|uniref:DUF6207 family protein n=1 Tax=Streptomyces sp. B21-083 TaxID=3039410 RepID=UPI002FF2C333